MNHHHDSTLRSRSSPAWLLLAVAGIASWLPVPAGAQADRYELGRRLRGFEQRWDQPADQEARKRAAEALNDSVGGFFRMELGEAARAMTRAFRLLDGLDPPPDAVAWADAIAFSTTTRLIDRGRPDLEALFAPVYRVEVEAPAEAVARVSIAIGQEEDNPRTLLEAALEGLPLGVSIPTADLPEGDHLLLCEVVVSGEAVSRSETILSVVDRLADRLESAGKAIASWAGGDASLTTDAETARQHVQMLRNLSEGAASEADIHAAGLMGELESLVAAIGDGRPFHGPGRPGSFRMALASPEGRSIPSRVFVPEVIGDGTAVPLVVALHGMGGSENLFFDGYGRGAVVGLCRDRGWLLVSPRRGPVGAAPVEEVVEAMASLYPVDRSRILLVGHSMGAGQAIDALVRAPDRYAGVAALGGGGRVSWTPGLDRVPVFIGIGDRDFLLGNARQLQGHLGRLGCERVDYREYPDVEHLVIVQVALPDAFEFFDQIEPSRVEGER